MNFKPSLHRDLWREDAKLESTVGHAREELKAAERHLAGMMDRVRTRGGQSSLEITRRPTPSNHVPFSFISSCMDLIFYLGFF